MVFLPIVDRELRVMARQPKTWWRRVFVAGAGTLILLFVYWNLSRSAQAAQIGRFLFEGLAAFSFVGCLLAGPLATSDCISAEKREGTLGLLFLTDLRGYDVVFGKMCASALDMLFALLALMPLLAMPLLLGGITGAQFGLAMLGLLNILFLSLASGIGISAFCTNSRKAWTLVVVWLALLTIGLPVLGEEVLHIHLRSRDAPYFYALCPYYTMDLIFDRWTRRPPWCLWLNLGAMQALAWSWIMAACFFTARGWKDRPPSLRRLQWQERLLRWSLGNSVARRAYRLRLLDLNPICWLDDRYRLQKSLVWAALLGFMLIWIAKYLAEGRRWINDDAILLWGLGLHGGIGLWIAFRAGHRFVDDRHSGALEVLLCTPLSIREIVRGRLLALRRQFGWAILALIAFDCYLLFTLLAIHRAGHFSLRDEMTLACVCGILLLPLQASALAKTGLYQSLMHKSSVHAALGAIWRVVAVPWLGFGLLAIGYDTLLPATSYPFFPGLSLREAILIWFGLQATACVIFLALAHWHLFCNFRNLAAKPIKKAWWRRWLGM